MAQNPGRKKTSMIKTTLMQEKKAAKGDPEGAASVKKKAAAIGNIIMGLSLGSPIPAALRNISSAVMKQLTKRQLAKLEKIQAKKRRDYEEEVGDPGEKFTEGEALAREARREARKKKVDKFRRKIGMDEFEENPGLPRNMRNNNQIKMKRYAARRNRQAKILAEKKKKSLMGGSNKMYGETF